MKSRFLSRKIVILISISIFIVLILSMVFFINKSKSPVYIGFSGGMTGPLSSLGIEARNAFELKVKEFNESGGINGHMIETVILDDKNSPDTFHENIAFFDSQGIKIVVGPIISSMASAAKEEADHIILLSGSVASDVLIDIDDYFFRTTSSTLEQPKALITFLTDTNHYDSLPTVTIVYDSRNASYVNEWRAYFREHYSGDIINQFDVGSEDSMTEEGIINQLIDTPSDVLILLTPSLVTASFAQLIKLNDLAIDPIGISWAMTNDLIANGGSAVEGMKFIHVYYENGLSHENPDFVAKYTTAFGESPSFISGFYYECTGFLLESMIRSDSLDIDDVKQSLLDLEYKVINDTIDLNGYGDRNQEFIMYELKDGSYEPLNH